MHYGVVDRNNQLVHYVPIELPGARWPHDLGITKNYTILHDLPLFFDPEGAQARRARLVVPPANCRRASASFRAMATTRRSAGSKRSACYILHLANCYEDGDEVVMDGCIMPDSSTPGRRQQGGNIYDRIRATWTSTTIRR